MTQSVLGRAQASSNRPEHVIVPQKQGAECEQHDEHGQPGAGGLQQTIGYPSTERHRGERQQRQSGQRSEEQQCPCRKPGGDRGRRQTGLGEHASLQRGGCRRTARDDFAERGSGKLGRNNREPARAVQGQALQRAHAPDARRRRRHDGDPPGGVHVGEPAIGAEHLEHGGRDAVQDDGGDGQREDPPADPSRPRVARGVPPFYPRVPPISVRSVNVDGGLVAELGFM